MDINLITQKLDIKYYDSIIKYLSKSNIDYEWLNTHLNNINKNYTESETENKIEIQPPNNITITDNDMYKKSWSKLNPIHKVIKIKEFVNNLKIDSENDKNKLKDSLISLIKSKILTKKDEVKYDEINGVIISLTKLEYKDNKYIYPV